MDLGCYTQVPFCGFSLGKVYSAKKTKFGVEQVCVQVTPKAKKEALERLRRSRLRDSGEAGTCRRSRLRDSGGAGIYPARQAEPVSRAEIV